jgi:3-hydroxybutyryl-CoA dehydrogenase
MITLPTVAVVGAGTMGHGIAQLCAISGFPVLIFDIDERLASRGYDQIKVNLASLATKGKITKEESTSIAQRVSITKNLSSVRADIIIEAVIENLGIKQELFHALERVNSTETLLLTNTSSIRITDIGSGLKEPGRFAGLHFFNPPAVMKLVEIVRGPWTSQIAIDRIVNFAKQLGKFSVMATDSPGFIVNRVARHFYLEAMRAVESNSSTVETVDELMRNTGFKMGPFELMDLIGLDTNLAVTRSIHEGFHREERFRPCAMQEKLVAKSKLGKKTGSGFYEYHG